MRTFTFHAMKCIIVQKMKWKTAQMMSRIILRFW